MLNPHPKYLHQWFHVLNAPMGPTGERGPSNLPSAYERLIICVLCFGMEPSEMMIENGNRFMWE